MPSNLKTAKISLEIEVPVLTCGKCGKEEACHPHQVQTQEGLLIQLGMPFLPLRLGTETAFLCEVCQRFVKGALGSLGIMTPGSPGAPGS